MRDPLFQPIKINAIEVKNRICMSAMHTNMCDDFEVTDRLIDFYAEKARGGVGMITVVYATVALENNGLLERLAHLMEPYSGEHLKS